jgi:phosphoribosylanthranilate isomerase
MVPYKVCCIRSAEEVARAAEAGAWAVGLVGPMPSGPGVLTLAQIADIAPQVPAHVLSVLLSSKVSAAGIIEEACAAGTRAVQLVDAVSDEVLSQVRAALPGLKMLQVIHVRSAADVAEAERVARHPALDFLLLDSGSPDAEVPTLGGTGLVHDWSLSRQIVQRARVPVLLAGGLSAQNVAEAIAQVRPWGLDICSGLRSGADYALDGARLSAWTAALGGLSA